MELSRSTMPNNKFKLAFTDLANFSKTFKNKNVIVTGHTGFKGSWLVAWLQILGANIMGISLESTSKPSHFEELKISKKITDVRLNLLNLNPLKKKISNFKPDFIFHLAAQSIVNLSYKDPLLTWHTNLIGTINILEVLKNLKKFCVGVIVTSDKCYKNFEITRGYKENDVLGGNDPYSASKGAAEIAINSYIKSFLSDKKKYRIASARAGNVIGGGDWNSYRIIPDCIKAIISDDVVKIRNLDSTRPWQHVMELIYGYLLLAKKLKNDKSIHGESFNFGPRENLNYSVLDILKEIEKNWSNFQWKEIKNKKNKFMEAKLLSLNCKKVAKILGWQPSLNFSQTVKTTIDWYKSYYNRNENTFLTTTKQINEYQKIIKKIK